MAISGTFQADFGTFYEACRQSQVELRGFETSNRAVEKSINSMVDSFTGRKIISEATLMSEAVRKVGGASRLTTAELQRVGGVANEAAEKFTRWGREVPTNIKRLQEAAASTNLTLSGTARSIREVDNVLDLFGVHLGPARKAIADIGFAAEQGLGGLNGVAKAGLALGAGIAGWQVGRAVSEFFQLDDVLGRVTAKFLGMGDVAGEIAAVQMDAIARANKIANFEVTTYSTALAVNAEAAKAAVAANTKLSDSLARADGARKSAEQLAKYNAEIDLLRKEGVINSLTNDINTHAFSMAELAERYRISAEALALFGREAANVERIEKNNADKLKKLAEDLRQAAQERVANEAAAAAAKQKALYDEITSRTQANEARKAQMISEMEEQERALAATKRETAALQEQIRVAEAATRARGNTVEYDLSTEAGRKKFQRDNPGGSIQAGAEYFKTHTLAEAVAEGLVKFAGGGGNFAGMGTPSKGGSGAGSGAQGSGSGGSGFGSDSRRQQTTSEFGDGFGGAPTAGGFGGKGRGGIVVYAPVQVSGVFDPSSSHALSRTIGDGMYRSLLQGRKVPAA